MGTKQTGYKLHLLDLAAMEGRQQGAKVTGMWWQRNSNNVAMISAAAK